MKTSQKIVIFSTILILLASQCVAQILSKDQETFLEFISLGIKDKIVKKIVFPAPKNFNPNYSKRDIYIFNENIPFFNVDPNKISYRNISYYIFSKEELFFYNISSYISIEEFYYDESKGILKFLIIGSFNKTTQNYNLFKFDYKIARDRWGLKSKSISHEIIN